MDSRTLSEAKMSASPLSLFQLPLVGWQTLYESLSRTVSPPISFTPKCSLQDPQIRGVSSLQGTQRKRREVFYGDFHFGKDSVQ